MPAKNMPGRKAGEDLARSQCPEKRPGTQGPLRGDENHFKIRRIALRSISGRKAGKGSCRDAMPGEASGDARPTSSGSDAAAKEASQVNRQRLTYQLELSREPQRVSQKCSFSIDLEDDQ